MRQEMSGKGSKDSGCSLSLVWGGRFTIWRAGVEDSGS